MTRSNTMSSPSTPVNLLTNCIMPIKRTYFEKNCRTCGKTFTTYKSEKMNYCSQECKINRPTSLSPEAREKISIGRKKWLAKNPDKHPWKNNSKFISEPCERLKAFLQEEGILFVEEYVPLNDRGFSIDIAFPDIKLGIEVNGNQHYNKDGTLRSYYQERHNLIVKNGWNLIEMHYSDCFIPDRIMTILKNREQPDYSKIFKEREKRLLEKEKNKPLPRGEKQRINYLKSQEENIKKVLESDIDFGKFGWVSKVAEIVGVSQNGGARWMKRNLPNFYEENCYKRTFNKKKKEVPKKEFPKS